MSKLTQKDIDYFNRRFEELQHNLNKLKDAIAVWESKQ